jgi:exportin-2 (importin alpha re-exporter)
MPYVFQILSQLLESQKTGTLSQDYLQLIPPLIHPDLWRTKANTIPLVRLLQAYLRRGAANVIQADKLDGMLGVWQNLNSSKLYDTYGFDLLTTIFLEVPMYTPFFHEPCADSVGAIYNVTWGIYSRCF